jgi:hypothetical protein
MVNNQRNSTNGCTNSRKPKTSIGARPGEEDVRVEIYHNPKSKKSPVGPMLSPGVLICAVKDCKETFGLLGSAKKPLSAHSKYKLLEVSRRRFWIITVQREVPKVSNVYRIVVKDCGKY